MVVVVGCFLERNEEIHDRDEEEEEEQETRDLVSESKSSDLALNRLESLEALLDLVDERFDSKSLQENPVST